jgi:hypothetical protein
MTTLNIQNHHLTLINIFHVDQSRHALFSKYLILLIAKSRLLLFNKIIGYYPFILLNNIQ